MERSIIAFITGLVLLRSIDTSDDLQEVCDVEGSVPDDCFDNAYCCRQTECDNIYIDTYNYIEYDEPTKRCCTQAEKYDNPDHCRICEECCSEQERTIVPIPEHCSKCRACDESSTISSNKLGSNF